MEVRRASQTHQVPQVGLPQTAPVNRARKVSQSPTGATAFTNTSASFMRQTRVTTAATAIMMYADWARNAAGT